MTGIALAVADTLLPGDGVLPPASAAGPDLEVWAARHAVTLERAAAEAGGIAAFLAGDAGHRAAAVQRMAAADPAAFNAALFHLLAAYYGAAAVLRALGWRDAPPQPGGHAVTYAAPETWALLDRVRARGRLWR